MRKLLGDIEQERPIILPCFTGMVISGPMHVSWMFRRMKFRPVASTMIPEPDLHNIFSEPPKRNSADKWLRASSYVLASLLVGTLAWQFTHEAVRLSQNGSQLHNEAEVHQGLRSTCGKATAGNQGAGKRLDRTTGRIARKDKTAWIQPSRPGRPVKTGIARR